MKHIAHPVSNMNRFMIDTEIFITNMHAFIFNIQRSSIDMKLSVTNTPPFMFITQHSMLKTEFPMIHMKFNIFEERNKR